MTQACDRVRALLPHHADGELSEADARAIREHLTGCAECREAAAEWMALNRIVDEGLRLAEPVPADEVDAVIRRLRQARPIWQAAPAPVRFWRSWAPVAGLAALALVIAAVGSSLPPPSLADAGAAIRDQTTALVLGPGEFAGGVPQDYQALRRSARSWPEEAAEALVGQWNRGTQLSQAVTRRVGVLPLAACALLLLAANFAFAREVRSVHGRLQGG
jgi:anti-sigma factor RsiW